MTDDWQGDYVRKVRDDTRRYVEKLLKENEALRLKNASIVAQNRGLEEDLSAARRELDRQREMQAALEEQLAQIEKDNRRFTKEYLEIEKRNANLANLYVASYRLHGSLDHSEILEVIQEILINLVGSEEIAIFERDDDVLRLTCSFGVDSEQLSSVPMGKGVIGKVAQSGRPYFCEDSEPNDDGITACVPLLVDGTVTGVIVVFALLPQKTSLVDTDRELFDLLGTHSAVALYCSRLHSKSVLAAEVP